jgi:hypothetical protein
MKKKLLVCKNDNYNGSSCPRCLTKQNFLEFPAYEFATEGVPSNCDTCGAELSWETIDVRGPLNPKLIAAIAAGVLVIGTVVFFIMRPSSAVEEVVEPTEVVQTPPEVAPEPVVEEEPEATPAPDPVKPAEPAPVVSKAPTTTSGGSAPKGTQTLTVNGNTYKGEVLNGKPHGMGTMYYKQSTQISPKDLKKRMAESGDYLTGEFYEGNPVQGKLFDAGNNVKEIIMIGR